MSSSSPINTPGPKPSTNLSRVYEVYRTLSMILASQGPCQAECAETSPASDPTPSKQREPTLQRRGWVNGEHFDLQPASALASASAARASLCATSSCSSCLDSPKPGRADVAVRKDLACEPQLARPAAGVPRPRPSPGTGSMGKHWDVLGLSLRKCCPSDRLSLGTAGVRPRLGYGEPPLLSSARERPSVPCPLPAQGIFGSRFRSLCNMGPVTA